MRKLFVERGQVIGRGTVIDPEIRVTRGVSTRRGARLRCVCGNVYEAWLSELVERNGRINTQSCGCLLKDHIRRVAYRGGAKPVHGKTKHPLFMTWNLMLQRCDNPDFHKYPDYGGRGIKVCERWHDVTLFIEDIERELGPRPEGCTLDRTDNDGHYEPGNVQWATPRQQAANKRRSSALPYGVHWSASKRRYLVRVHVGTFTGEEEAAAAYRRAVEVLEREGILR